MEERIGPTCPQCKKGVLIGRAEELGCDKWVCTNCSLWLGTPAIVYLKLKEKKRKKG